MIEVGIGDVWDVPLVEAAREHDGQLFHADTGAEAGRIFGRLARQGAWVARDVQMQLEFDPQRVVAYRQIGHANLQIPEREFAVDYPAAEPVEDGPILGRRRAGELAAGQWRTALFEIEPARAGGGAMATFLVRARIAGKDRRWTHAVVDPGLRDLATTSNDFRFTAAVAELGLIVHGGPRGSASVEQVQALAAGAVGRDPSGERREFGAMVQQQRAVFAARMDEWAAEDTWLREHPLDASTPAIRAASRLPADVQPRLRRAGAVWLREWDVVFELVGLAETREGRTPAERAAIGLVRAEAVRRFLVEQAHVSPAQLEVRPARPEDRPHHGDPAANRSVRFNFVQRGLEQ